jgi:pilus assembly protein CpaD
MRHPIKLLLGSVCLALAACATPPGPEFAGHEVEQRFPITVTPEMRNLRIASRGPGSTIDPVADAQIAQFAREYADKGVGAISVSAPPNWNDIARQVADRLVDHGIPANRILIGTDGQPQLGAEVSLSFVRYFARTEPCGNWSEDVAVTWHNRPMPNLGCAMQQNIAAMVADPQDLIAPKPLGAADVQRALTVLDNYRKGQPTPATKSEEQSGVVSQIAQ